MNEHKEIIFTRRTYGAIFLIAGSCIGAGMLGLPIITGMVGFVPSLFVFTGVWLYMMVTALLLLEANLWFKNKEINLITLAGHILGKPGQVLVWCTFIFLFYCLLIAYIVKGGTITQQLLEYLFNTEFSDGVGAFVLTTVTILFVSFGAKSVDSFNRICVIALAATFFYLIALTGRYIEPTYLDHKDWTGALSLVPFLLATFGFHNVIPTVKNYLGHDRKKTEAAIKVGGAIPLVVYILWIGVMLSVLPLSGSNSILSSFINDKMATEALGTIVNSQIVGLVASGFAFFAILTSILAQGLSMTDFLADGFKLNQYKYGKQISCLMAFLPPYIITLINPNVFYIALEYAGGVAAIILFGLLPALIVWRGRYYYCYQAEYRIMRGSRLVLLVVMLGAFFVFGLQMSKTLNTVDLRPITLLNALYERGE